MAKPEDYQDEEIILSPKLRDSSNPDPDIYSFLERYLGKEEADRFVTPLQASQPLAGHTLKEDAQYDTTGMPVARDKFVGFNQIPVLRRKKGVEGAVEDMQVGLVRRRLNEWVRYDNGTGFFKPGNARTVAEGIADELYDARRHLFKPVEVTDASIRVLLRLKEYEARTREGSFGSKDKLIHFIDSKEEIKKNPYIKNLSSVDTDTRRQEREAERARELAELKADIERRRQEKTRALAELQSDAKRERQKRNLNLYYIEKKP